MYSKYYRVRTHEISTQGSGYVAKQLDEATYIYRTKKNLDCCLHVIDVCTYPVYQ